MRMRRPIRPRSSPATETSKSSGSLGSAGMAIIVSLFTCVAPSHRDQPYRVTSPDMHGSIKFALDETDRLVSLLAVDFPMGGESHMGRIAEYFEAERQFQAMLEPIGLVFGRIIFEIHAVVYVIHTVRSEEHTSELQSLMRISYAV